MDLDGDQGGQEKLSILQKIILISLYFLIILMVVFSIAAINNGGVGGFNRCIENKCAKFGDEFCNKFREINNCCAGAGGGLAQTNDGLKCVFE